MNNAQELLNNKTLWKKVEYRDLTQKDPAVVKYESVMNNKEEVTAITDRVRPRFSNGEIKVEGELMIDGKEYPNLLEVRLTQKNLTKVVIKDCKKLRMVELADNENLTEIDLQGSTIMHLTLNQTSPSKFGKVKKVNLGKCKDLETVIATRGSNDPDNIWWVTEEFPLELTQFVGGPQESVKDDIDLPIEQFMRDELVRKGFKDIVNATDAKKIDWNQLKVYAGSLKELSEILKIDAEGKMPNKVSELIKDGITDLQKKLAEAEKNQASQAEIDNLKKQIENKDKEIKGLQDEKKELEEKLTGKQGTSKELQDKIDKLEAEKTTLEKEKLSLSQDLIASQKEVIEKQKEVIAAKDESKKLTEEKGKLEVEKINLQTSLKKAEDDLTTSQSELTKAKEERDEYKNKLTQQQADYKKIEDEKEKLEAELKALRETKQIINNNFHNLINAENKVDEKTLEEITDQIVEGHKAKSELEEVFKEVKGGLKKAEEQITKENWKGEGWKLERKEISSAKQVKEAFNDLKEFAEIADMNVSVLIENGLEVKQALPEKEQELEQYVGVRPKGEK